MDILTGLPFYMKETVNFMAEAGLVLAVVLIILSGFLFVTALGNDEKIKKAKKTFLWTIVGIAVFFGSFRIIASIMGTIAGL